MLRAGLCYILLENVASPNSLNSEMPTKLNTLYLKLLHSIPSYCELKPLKLKNFFNSK